MKHALNITIGIIGSGIASYFGGWDNALITLLIFMLIDYLTGLILAGVFHKSPKSQDGALESKASWKGLARKSMVLIFILIANRLDVALGTSYIRDAVCISYISNEALSIIENAGMMGVPIPKKLKNAIDILKNRGEK